MTTINEHTGDYLRTGVPSEEFKENFDNIDWSAFLNRDKDKGEEKEEEEEE